ncbi:NgoBV family restriction endonuclease [Anabaena minutissima FACHB-250]|nr:NgoBV family restriction endonuclease [Anabaena minutissima FACHB-250]
MTYHPIANHIYKLLIQEQVIHSEGKIIFNFLNTSIEINDKSAFGYLFQEWLAEWMRQKEIKFRTTLNTQEFPDFLLEQDDNNIGLLTKPSTFYNKKPKGDLSFKMRSISKNKVPLVSKNPCFVPALLKG